MTARQLQAIARQHGTPVVVVDHDLIRRNYAAFRKHLPKVQAYYAVKANPAPEIVHTLYRAGSSFDVASLPEFTTQAELDATIAKLETEMRDAARKFEFEKAARLRDTIKEMRDKEFLFG